MNTNRYNYTMSQTPIRSTKLRLKKPRQDVEEEEDDIVFIPLPPLKKSKLQLPLKKDRAEAEPSSSQQNTIKILQDIKLRSGALKKNAEEKEEEEEEEEEDNQAAAAKFILAVDPPKKVKKQYTVAELNSVNNAQTFLSLSDVPKNKLINVDGFKFINTQYGRKIVIEIYNSTTIVFLPERYNKLYDSQEDLDKLTCSQVNFFYKGKKQIGNGRWCHDIEFGKY